jgi:two-component system, response regulator RegA
MSETKSLLIVEDDASFARTLQRSFKRRGYEVYVAESPDNMRKTIALQKMTHAVVDLKLGSASGLLCVEALRSHDRNMRIVVLTGYASIGTAVEAIKLGACHYLAKPSNSDDIEAAFGRIGGHVGERVANRATNFKTLEWEMIHRTLAEADFNISETARRLGMHRRTLARKLEKRRVD